MNKSRLLISAAVYRKYWFESEEELYKWIENGRCERWLVEKKRVTQGLIAVVGEQYNECRTLRMEVMK